MKKRMIINLITLSVTTFLLIITIMAWYTSNREVSANGITGSTQEYESIIEEVNIYYATKVNNTTYTKGNLVASGDKMIYDQFPEVYAPSEHGDISYSAPPRLVELVIKSGKELNKLDIQTSSRCFPGMDNRVNPGYITVDDGVQDSDVTIALSPFLKFNLVSVSGTTINVSSFKKYTYNDNTGIITATSINLIESSMTGSIYLLFDFDDEKFEQLYSNNIGNTIVDEASQINHYLDFKFIVFGGDVQ